MIIIIAIGAEEAAAVEGLQLLKKSNTTKAASSR
jgi:hypothetical protein